MANLTRITRAVRVGEYEEFAREQSRPVARYSLWTGMMLGAPLLALVLLAARWRHSRRGLVVA